MWRAEGEVVQTGDTRKEKRDQRSVYRRFEARGRRTSSLPRSRPSSVCRGSIHPARITALQDAMRIHATTAEQELLFHDVNFRLVWPVACPLRLCGVAPCVALARRGTNARQTAPHFVSISLTSYLPDLSAHVIVDLPLYRVYGHTTGRAADSSLDVAFPMMQLPSDAKKSLKLTDVSAIGCHRCSLIT